MAVDHYSLAQPSCLCGAYEILVEHFEHAGSGKARYSPCDKQSESQRGKYDLRRRSIAGHGKDAQVKAEYQDEHQSQPEIRNGCGYERAHSRNSIKFGVAVPGRKNAEQHSDRDRYRETRDGEEESSGEGLSTSPKDRYACFQISAKVTLHQPPQEVEVLNVEGFVQPVLLDEVLRQSRGGVGRSTELRRNGIAGSEFSNQEGNECDSDDYGYGVRDSLQDIR